ncbi:MAG: helix-turn-helix domain containing protein [Patescibacteria group bacterium]|nr:helix-turn-helix domain containing protein [Patescibacteria group bacterium]
MAKSKEKIQATSLRRKGKSLTEISDILDISKSTASLWCRNIELTKSQIKALEKKRITGSYMGCLKGARAQRNKREEQEKRLLQEGISETSGIGKKEFFTAGLGIYWGEGMKTSGVTGIVNSDPKMIKFMIIWFKTFCEAKNKDFICRVGINQKHQGRVKYIEKYWSKTSGIPLSQFTKTAIYKSESKKEYLNPENYYGTLRIKIRNGSRHQRKIKGWIEGLSRAA